MASFYGSGSRFTAGSGTGSEGGAGSSSPINVTVNCCCGGANGQSIKGNDGSPIILSQLENGIYTLDGKYAINYGDELQQFDNAILVTVKQENGKRIAYYIFVRDGKTYIRIYTFEEDGSYSYVDEELGNSKPELIEIDDDEEEEEEEQEVEP